MQMSQVESKHSSELSVCSLRNHTHMHVYISNMHTHTGSSSGWLH